eukprot:14664406-Ditylum_brightwellii.AAC.1
MTHSSSSLMKERLGIWPRTNQAFFSATLENGKQNWPLRKNKSNTQREILNDVGLDNPQGEDIIKEIYHMIDITNKSIGNLKENLKWVYKCFDELGPYHNFNINS